MTATLDRPVKEPAFHPLSGRRKATNAIATVLVSSAVLIALVPLVWVLYTVFDRGFAAILSADWWFKSQNMMTNRIAGGRCVSRYCRHPLPRLVLRDHLGADRHLRGHLPCRVRP